MGTVNTFIIVVLILVAGITFLRKMNKSTTQEGYRSCRGCDGNVMPWNSPLALNPFVYPYSGTSCLDDVYKLGADGSVDVGFNDKTLTHLSEPNHIQMVG